MADAAYAYEPANGTPEHVAEAAQAHQDEVAASHQQQAPVSYLNADGATNGTHSPNLNGDAASNHSAAGALANAPTVLRKTLSSWVGFSNLPNQVHRRSVR